MATAAFALVSGGLMAGIAGPQPQAGASTVDTPVTFPCTAYPQTSLSGPQGTSIDTVWHATAPDTVLPGASFTITATLDSVPVPTSNSGYNVNSFHSLSAKIPDPSNVNVTNVSISGGDSGWGVSHSGGVTTIADSTSYSGGSTINMPTITWNVTTTGVAGQTVDLRLGGQPTYNDSSNPSLSFIVNVASPIGGLDVDVDCYAPGSPATLIHSTAINVPDTTGPTITITTPGNLASYGIGQTVNASYSCNDPSGVASCNGTVVNGAAIDTSTTGTHMFTVNARDSVGNTSSSSVTYSVVNLPIVNVHGGTGVEGPGATVPFTVSVSRPPASGNVVVGYQTVDGSAVAGSDYTAASGSLTFTPTGAVSQTVNVGLINNNTPEPTKSFGLSFTSVSGGVAGSSTSARIVDDDLAGVRASCSSASQGSAIPCTISLLSQPHAPVSVSYHTTDGTATSPAQYTAASGSVSFSPGDALTKTISISTTGQAGATTADTTQFTFSATLAGSNTSTATAAIIQASQLQSTFSIGDVSVHVPEAAPPTNIIKFNVPVTQNHSSGFKSTVVVNTVNGTATAPANYVAIVAKKVAFRPGVTFANVPVTINAATLAQGTETFSLVLSSPSAGTRLGRATGTITLIQDSPTSATPQVFANDISIVEHDIGPNNKVSVPITLSRPATVRVPVSYSIVPVTATQGVDFVPPVSKQTTFAPGQRIKLVNFTIKPDSIYEGNETVDVHITGTHLPAVVSKADGVLTIVDNGDAGVPAGLTATASASLDSVDLAWSAPTVTGRVTTGYDYRVSTDNVHFGSWITTGSGTNTYATVPCAASSTCYYQVRADNDNGAGNASSSASASGLTDTTPPTNALLGPVNGGNVGTQAAPVFTGDAGVASGDSSTVTVYVYSGIGTGGALVDTESGPGYTGTYSINGSGPYAPGTYTAVATQSDWAGNTVTSNAATFQVRNAVFVSARGSDSSAGTAASPKLTIANALSTAASQSRPQVVVGAGTFSSGTGIAPSSNVSVLGGFDSYNGWTRPGTAGTSGTPDNSQTLVTGAPQAALVSGAFTVTFDGMSLAGQNTGLGAGASVYGVRAVGGANVTLNNVNASAAAGVAGAAGAQGAIGTDGCGGAAGSTNNTSNGSSCGGSGVAAAGAGGGGGAEGGFFSSGSDGNNGGNGGGGAGGGGGGEGGYCVTPSPGNGGAGSGGGGGSAGSAGGAGTGGTGGVALAGATWVGGNGGTGTGGAAGGGGGGAGGGGGTYCAGGADGAQGGGAGAGGVAGGGGGGGTAGGGSFAVYAFNATITIATNSGSTFMAAPGGAGGSGGAGGPGGNGGGGASGAVQSKGGNAGGGGGGGGAGGGGGGGGAQPGPSVALFHGGSGTLTVGSGNTLSHATVATAGAAGAGGHAGNAGSGGASIPDTGDGTADGGGNGTGGASASGGSAGGGALACTTLNGTTCSP